MCKSYIFSLFYKMLALELLPYIDEKDNNISKLKNRALCLTIAMEHQVILPVVLLDPLSAHQCQCHGSASSPDPC